MSNTPLAARSTSTAALVGGSPARSKPRRRRSVAVIITAGLLFGAVGGVVADNVSDRAAQDQIERGRTADTARLQGAYDAYVQADMARQALARAQQAGSARLQEAYDAYVSTESNSPRFSTN